MNAKLSLTFEFRGGKFNGPAPAFQQLFIIKILGQRSYGDGDVDGLEAGRLVTCL